MDLTFHTVSIFNGLPSDGTQVRGPKVMLTLENSCLSGPYRMANTGRLAFSLISPASDTTKGFLASHVLLPTVFKTCSSPFLSIQDSLGSLANWKRNTFYFYIITGMKAKINSKVKNTRSICNLNYVLFI